MLSDASRSGVPATFTPEQFGKEVKIVCDMYDQALDLYQKGTHIVSTDERTGIQASERKHLARPMISGRVELREFEYIRHGTLALIANFEVALGQVIVP